MVGNPALIHFECLLELHKYCDAQLVLYLAKHVAKFSIRMVVNGYECFDFSYNLMQQTIYAHLHSYFWDKHKLNGNYKHQLEQEPFYCALCIG